MPRRAVVLPTEVENLLRIPVGEAGAAAGEAGAAQRKPSIDVGEAAFYTESIKRDNGRVMSKRDIVRLKKRYVVAAGAAGAAAVAYYVADREGDFVTLAMDLIWDAVYRMMIYFIKRWFKRLWDEMKERVREWWRRVKHYLIHGNGGPTAPAEVIHDAAVNQEEEEPSFFWAAAVLVIMLVLAFAAWRTGDQERNEPAGSSSVLPFAARMLARVRPQV